MRDVGRDRQAVALGLPHELDTFARRQAAHVNLRTGGTLQFENRVQRHRLCDHRHGRQSEPACERAGTRHSTGPASVSSTGRNQIGSSKVFA